MNDTIVANGLSSIPPGPGHSSAIEIRRCSMPANRCHILEIRNATEGLYRVEYDGSTSKRE